MHIKLLSVAVGAALLAGCGTLSGDGASEGSSGYVVGKDGLILTGDGECVRDKAWGDDSTCGEMDKEEMMAEKAPEPEENPAPPPPPPPPPAPAPAPEPASVEKVVLSGRALFPYDSADLTAQGSREMDGLIDKLGSYQDIELIDVVGHADSRGSLEYNQALSERRAETVKGKLEGAFPQVPITASGLGETAPIASNDTAEGRRLNRRVEIRVEAIN
jgi:OOP family OmpA-OmpF porin